MSNLDEEFEQILAEIEAGTQNLTSDEHKTAGEWISKLREFDEYGDKNIRNEYARLLKSQLTRDQKHLSLPFVNKPPDNQLPPLQELLNQRRKETMRPDEGQAQPSKKSPRYFCSPTLAKPPCRPKTVPSKVPERIYKEEGNEFENYDEMAKIIARSKGMSLAEFVAEISRHTSDKGQGLRNAMKEEIASFSDYVERVFSQREKDLSDLLDGKQNYELLKVQRDCEKWESELSFCKKRIKEIVPDFDIEKYRRDRNYLKKMFTVGTSPPPPEDKFKEWKEENCHRLMWFVNEIKKLTEQNNELIKEIGVIQSKTIEFEQKDSQSQQCHSNYMSAEGDKIRQLKQKSDKLAREIADLLMSQES